VSLQIKSSVLAVYKSVVSLRSVALMQEAYRFELLSTSYLSYCDISAVSGSLHLLLRAANLHHILFARPLLSEQLLCMCMFRLHRMHEIQTIVTNDHGVCP